LQAIAGTGGAPLIVWACLSLPKTNCWTQSTTDADHPSYGVQNEVSAPSVKQQLAAVRMLFDWLVIGQVVPTNPAAAVRGPKHGLCHGNERRLGRGQGPARAHAAATAFCHCAAASALKIRSVDRETRCR
jgi:hypothetical protein